MIQKDDKLNLAIKKLSQYDEWATVCEWVREMREAKFQALSGDNQRIDAKVVGAMAEDDYIYNTLKQNL